MQTINIHEAKSHLSKLVELAFDGEEIVICKAGKPMVRLVKYQQENSERTPGYWKDQVHIFEDFDQLPQSISAAFRGDVD